MTIWMFHNSKLLLGLFVVSVCSALGIFFLGIEPDNISELGVLNYVFVLLCTIAGVSLYLVFLSDVRHGRSKHHSAVRKTLTMILPTLGLLFVALMLVNNLGGV